MAGPDPRIKIRELFPEYDDAQVEAMLELGRKIQPTIGADDAATQQAVFESAKRVVDITAKGGADDAANKRTAAEKEFRTLVKRAAQPRETYVGRTPPEKAALERQWRADQIALVKYYEGKGMDPDAAGRAAAADIAPWGAKLGRFDIQGRKPDDWSKSKSNGDGKDTTNPWKLPDGPEANAARGKIVATLGYRVAEDLAKAAGKTVEGRTLAA